ncbi:MAG: class I SAM-dependent methyltransferase [Lachnospiraceae bacterium]|nr:class I SAM-dependent methyltransferase [Lachnospiraceae bacterium]
MEGSGIGREENGMNDIWSKHVQGTKTLYYSRKLRFNDMFAERYKALFDVNEDRSLRILEIGCGPGALAGALHRWYPKAEVTGVDRDSAFISFARKHENGITFMEGDITALPFADNSFDVVISHTVSEHIEPSIFYGVQMRLLKENGICLVLSSRRGIHIAPDCLSSSDVEKRFWEKAKRYDDTLNQYSICRYPMNEAQLPASMESYGFRNTSTGFVTVDLTPDHPKYSNTIAHEMIDADRYADIDAIDSVFYKMPEYFTVKEIEEMKRMTHAKYDIRIAQYDRGERQWDTNVAIIMVIRGVKFDV